VIVRREKGVLELYRQDDHATAAARLAQAYGAEGFVVAEPRATLVRIVSLHDRGWVGADAAPKVDPRTARPRDFLHTPAEEAVAIWSESIRLAAEAVGPLGGAIVSKHFDRLAAAAVGSSSQSAENKFFLRRFQSRQAELQAGWRTALNQLSTPPEAQAVGVAAALLQGCDMFSVFLLLGAGAKDLRPEPCSLGRGLNPVAFRIAWPEERAVSIAPWPFRSRAIQLEIPCRRVPDYAYDNDEDVRRAVAAAKVAPVAFRVIPG
jgi:hypothetical protein